MIKLVASDLDGTLLQGGAQQLAPHSIDLIHRLVQRAFVLSPQAADNTITKCVYFQRLKTRFRILRKTAPSIFHNGEVISRSVIDQSLASRIVNGIKKNPAFEIVISREDSCFIENNNPEFVNHIVNVMKNTTQVVDDIRTVDGPILKIAICNMDDGAHIIDKYLKHLQDLFGAEIKVVTSGNIWIDFIAPGTNKGTALEKLTQKLGIKPEECMAFGDQYNDVEMLQFVGTSYAMSNAAPGISYYSTYVTDSVDDVLEDLLAALE